MASISSDQSVKIQTVSKLPYFTLFQVVKKELDAEEQIKLMENKIQLKSEQTPIVETEGETVQSFDNVLSFNPQKSAFRPYQQDRYEDLFTQNTDEKIGSLKIVKGKQIKNQKFYKFYKKLKGNSPFPGLIPTNTIVLVRIQNDIIWPAIIVDQRSIYCNVKNKRIIYKVNLINKENSYEVPKLDLVQFNHENIEKVKIFSNNKKLLKTLKIAEKLNQSQNQKMEKERQVFKFQFLQNAIEVGKIVQNILLKGEQTTQYNPIKNDQLKKINKDSFVLINNHWKPLNLVLETPKISVANLFKNDIKRKKLSQQQSKSEYQDQLLKIEFKDDETYMSENQNQIDKLQRNEDFFIQKKRKRNTVSKVQRNKQFKQSYNNEKPQIRKILRYVWNYKKQLSQQKIKKKTGLDKILSALKIPLEELNNEDISIYLRLIDICVQLCINNFLRLTCDDKAFISSLKEILRDIYWELANYEGENQNILGIKQQLLPKLILLVNKAN